MEKENDIQKQIDKLEKEIQASDFWGDKNKAQSILKELAELKNKKAGANKYDKGSAIITIISGAGGDDAEDFGAMLLSMYMKYANKKGWKISFIHEHKNEHNGYKNVSFEIIRKGAYGTLKNESGVHRLVRISPYDANSRRHTSFASVFVYPEIDETIKIEIDEAELRIDTYRSSGAGGQSVNKTDSAVRITHLPTNIVVACQNERSQHKNKAMAMKILRSRLYEFELEKQKERMETFHKTKKEIAWGSQIRSYVLHPYRMVKDHRTGIEVGNADAVLDGDIDRFIQAYLLQVSESHAAS